MKIQDKMYIILGNFGFIMKDVKKINNKIYTVWKNENIDIMVHSNELYTKIEDNEISTTCFTIDNFINHINRINELITKNILCLGGVRYEKKSI